MVAKFFYSLKAEWTFRVICKSVIGVAGLVMSHVPHFIIMPGSAKHKRVPFNFGEGFNAIPVCLTALLNELPRVFKK